VVHRLLGVLAEPQSARGLAAHGLASPMVGRTEELEQLIAAFDRMQRGRAQIVSVVGEAGTGKSRLIAEFLRRLEADGRFAGTAVRRANCSSLGEPPYGAFAALFREGYRVDPGWGSFPLAMKFSRQHGRCRAADRQPRTIERDRPRDVLERARAEGGQRSARKAPSGRHRACAMCLPRPPPSSGCSRRHRRPGSRRDGVACRYPPRPGDYPADGSESMQVAERRRPRPAMDWQPPRAGLPCRADRRSVQVRGAPWRHCSRRMPTCS
jgi:hypothetical protein